MSSNRRSDGSSVVEANRSREPLGVNAQAVDHRLRLAAEMVGLGSWEWNTVDDRVEWSPEVLGSLELDRNECPPTLEFLNGLLHGDDLERVTSAMEAQLKGGPAFDLTCRLRHRSGEYIAYRIASRAHDGEGQPSSVFGILQPIGPVSPRRAAPAFGNQSEQRYRRLVENSPVCIHEIDLQGRVTSMNQAGLGMLGLHDESQVLGVRVLDIVCLEDRGRVAHLLEQAVLGHGSEFSFTTVPESGSRRFASCLIPVTDSDGRVDRLMGITDDVTDKVGAEEALRDNEARFRAMIENSCDVMAVFDERGKLTYISPVVERVLGYAPSELLGGSVELIHPDDLAKAEEMFASCLCQPGKTAAFRHRMRHKDGGYRVMEGIGTNLLHLNCVGGMLSNFHDVTARVEAEEELRRQRRFAELVSRISTDLINSPVEEIDSLIDSIITAIGEFSEVDQVYLFQHTPDGEHVLFTHEYTREGVAPQIGLLPLQKRPLAWWRDSAEFSHVFGELRRGQPFVVNSIEDLPSHLESLRKSYQLKNMKSELTIPLLGGDTFLGYYGFEMRGEPREWTTDFVAQASAIGRVISNALLRKTTESALRRTQFAVDNNRNPIFWMRPNGRVAYANKAAATSLGLSKSELIDLDVASFDPDWDAERFRTEAWPALRKHGSMTFETRHRRMDGTIFPVEITANLFRYQGEELSSAFVTDISDRKRAQDELAKTRSLLEAAIDSSPAGIIIADAPTGRICLANLAALEVRGKTSEQLTEIPIESYAQNWQCYYQDGRLYESSDLPLARAILHGETSENVEMMVKRGDGQMRWALVSAGPIHDSKGTRIAGIVVFSDVTDLRRAASEREKLIRELEAKNSELEQFTYTVSHDLKSPIITIQGFVGLLQKEIDAKELSDAQKRVERIQSAANQMSRLLDELLELSRLGRICNPMERLSMTELAKQAAELVAQTLEQHKAILQIEEDLPMVRVDRTRMVQVLQNLIENSAKFSGSTKTPVIEIGMRRQDDSSVFTVTDNGMGVAPKYQEQVFRLFEQLNPKLGGTGLGLAIVKRIIEIHRGRIWMESEGDGRGTTVCFTLGPS